MYSEIAKNVLPLIVGAIIAAILLYEIVHVIKDIATGALPADEIPDYVRWLLSKAFWPLFLVVVFGVVLVVLRWS